MLKDKLEAIIGGVLLKSMKIEKGQVAYNAFFLRDDLVEAVEKLIKERDGS